MNEDKPIADAESADLDWQAFRYLSGEMSPDEIVDFETQLAEDQAAREALAGQVELTQALAVCESHPTEPVVLSRHSSPSSWFTRSLWLALGATAALVLVMLYRGGSSGDVADGSLKGPDDPDSLAAVQQKALLWTEIHSELAEQDGPSYMADESLEVSGLLASSDQEAGDFQEAPSWMTTAVLGLHEQASENGIQEN